MHKVDLKIITWKEEKHFIAECLNNNVSSFGDTKKEALKNLNEALELYFEDEPSYIFLNIQQPEITESTFAYA